MDFQSIDLLRIVIYINVFKEQQLTRNFLTTCK